jgi:hypothetical protein
MKMDGLKFWNATYLALLAIGDVLTPRQQCKVQENFRKLARVRERRGDTISSNFLHALAQERAPLIEDEHKFSLRLAKAFHDGRLCIPDESETTAH